MELRQPTLAPPPPRGDALLRGLAVASLVLLAVIAAALWLAPGGRGEAAADPALIREVAGKLKAAGALDEAAELYERYFETGGADAGGRAKIAYSLGTTYLDRGRHERALRWFYLAETLGAGDLESQVGEKIVQSLERLGRLHAAQAALDSRVRLGAPAAGASEADPVVARIGEREILRSEVESALDDLPPEVARQAASAEGRQAFLRRFVADELLWRKARKLEYDDDPAVLRRHAALLKQLAVSRFVEREIVAGIRVDEADLRNFFAANRERYAAAGSEGEEPDFDRLRPRIEGDYRLGKIETAYAELIEQELATSEVVLFAERMSDGP